MKFLRALSAGVVTLGLIVAAAPAHAGPPGEKQLVITTLSSAPNRASGGDVLVRIEVPRTVSLSDVQVMQVANFVRSSWGNRGPRVSLDDVARLRPQSH